MSELKGGRMMPTNDKAVHVISPQGKRRKIHYIPNTNGFGAHAWVKVGIFKRIDQYAAGPHVVDNLVRRLKKKGWRVVE